MRSIQIFLSVLFIVCSQSKVELKVITRMDFEEFSRFERELVEYVVESFNKRNSNKQYSITFIKDSSFNDTIERISGTTSDSNICAIRGITVSKRDKITFSKPYFPLNNAIIALKKRKTKNWRIENVRIGFINGGKLESFLDSLRTLYKFETVGIDEDLESLLISGEIDFYLGDSVTSYFNKEFEIVEVLDSGIEYLGIIYPEGSPLKNEFDPIIEYLGKSIKFYSMLKRYFGNDISSYYKNTMHGSSDK